MTPNDDAVKTASAFTDIKVGGYKIAAWNGGE
jgi:hypothetical protein